MRQYQSTEKVGAAYELWYAQKELRTLLVLLWPVLLAFPPGLVQPIGYRRVRRRPALVARRSSLVGKSLHAHRPPIGPCVYMSMCP